MCLGDGFYRWPVRRGLGGAQVRLREEVRLVVAEQVLGVGANGFVVVGSVVATARNHGHELEPGADALDAESPRVPPRELRAHFGVGETLTGPGDATLAVVRWVSATAAA